MVIACSSSSSHLGGRLYVHAKTHNHGILNKKGQNIINRVLSPDGRHFSLARHGIRFLHGGKLPPKRQEIIERCGSDVLDTFHWMEETSDCFANDDEETMLNNLPYYLDDDDGKEEEPCVMYARLDSIKPSHANDDVRCNYFLPLKKNLQNVIRGCYFSCPGEAYNCYHPTHRPINHDDRGHETVLSSLRTLKEKVVDAIPSPTRRKTTPLGPETMKEEEMEALEEEPSPTVLSGIIQQLVPCNIWNALTGREFFFPSVLSGLARMGIQTALFVETQENIEWNPADTKTRKLLEMNDKNVLRQALDDEDVLVWTGKFKMEGHGSHLPIVKTASVLPMSPKEMASLLMDSSKVQSYNKMSLGRKDEVILQQGIDTDAKSGSMGIGGEAKIVRNLTKPPLSKKLMEFVTIMYARRLESDDHVGVGIMGGNHQDGYVVVSRAVSGGQWGTLNREGEESERTRSEILLGVNLIRSIPGESNKCEVIAVTHCNSPFVPKMLAGSVGVKGAVDFVRDVRAMFGSA